MIREEVTADGTFTTPEAVRGCFQGTNWNLRPVCHAFAVTPLPNQKSRGSGCPPSRSPSRSPSRLIGHRPVCHPRFTYLSTPSISDANEFHWQTPSAIANLFSGRHQLLNRKAVRVFTVLSHDKRKWPEDGTFTFIHVQTRETFRAGRQVFCHQVFLTVVVRLKCTSYVSLHQCSEQIRRQMEEICFSHDNPR
jgi:hypothetical protein